MKADPLSSLDNRRQSQTEVDERDRYRKSERAEKKKIVDEFVELAGYHRKHAIRVFRSERRIKNADAGMANRLYDEAVITALTIIREAADRICG